MTLLNKNIDYKIISFKYVHKFDCPVDYLNSCVEKSCHCSYIDNFSIINIDHNKLVKFIYDQYYDKSKSTFRFLKINELLGNITKSIEYYSIDRIVSHFKLWSKSSYIPNITKGYYGQDINGCLIKTDLVIDVENNIQNIIKHDNIKDRIYSLLEMEYGFVLPKLLNKKVAIKKVLNSSIYIGNNEYLNKVKGKKKFEVNNKLIMGILLKENGLYNLIDGYNRYVNNENKYSLYIVFE